MRRAEQDPVLFSRPNRKCQRVQCNHVNVFDESPAPIRIMALNEEHLIDAVREHRCLWNITTKAYKDQRARENSWSNISRELGFPADVCAKRWKSLRHTFVRELEKTNKRKTGSKGPPPRSALSHICEPNDALC